MRTWRASFGVVFLALAGFCSSESARAQLLVLGTPGEPPAVAHAELAYASGEGLPVTWLSLRLQRGPVALVAALPRDALSDVGLDAWFDALELTASPNVTLPSLASNCGQTASFVHVAWPRSEGEPAVELSLSTKEDARSALEGLGFAVDGELPPAERYLIWSWTARESQQTTRTLRIVGGSEPLALLPGAGFPVLVSSVTRGSAALPGELLNRELSVTFVADQEPGSDYRERLQDWLGSRPEPLLETRARGPLFDWSIYADMVSLRSLVQSYAASAAKELPELDADACAEQLRALRDPGAPSAAACGQASDANLALAAAGTELPTLQRFVVSGAHGLTPAEANDGGVPSPPILRAQALDASACPVIDQPLPAQPPGGNRGSGPSGPNGSTTVVVEETVVVDETPPAEVSCGSSPQPEDHSSTSSNDSCASDTSSTSESDSSGSSDCSGDSSSSSSNDSSGCGSDSSSSGSSDSGCGSDSSSSSSSSSDTSCDGGSDESSGYDGDTCSGAAAPGAERAQKTQAGLSPHRSVRRPARLKTSLWSMAFVALILPIRRRKRGRGACG